jgi:hypothetical protein
VKIRESLFFRETGLYFSEKWEVFEQLNSPCLSLRNMCTFVISLSKGKKGKTIPVTGRVGR